MHVAAMLQARAPRGFQVPLCTPGPGWIGLIIEGSENQPRCCHVAVSAEAFGSRVGAFGSREGAGGVESPEDRAASGGAVAGGCSSSLLPWSSTVVCWSSSITVFLFFRICSSMLSGTAHIAASSLEHERAGHL